MKWRARSPIHSPVLPGARSSPPIPPIPSHPMSCNTHKPALSIGETSSPQQLGTSRASQARARPLASCRPSGDPSLVMFSLIEARQGKARAHTRPRAVSSCRTTADVPSPVSSEEGRPVLQTAGVAGSAGCALVSLARARARDGAIVVLSGGFFLGRLLSSREVGLFLGWGLGRFFFPPVRQA